MRFPQLLGVALAATCTQLVGAAPALAQVQPVVVEPAPSLQQRVLHELNPGTWAERASSLVPAWVPGQREETISVRRPVVETRMVEQAVTVNRPTTTYQPMLLDQGGWTTQEVVAPGGTRPKLRFVGGWTIDEATGQRYWRLPLLRLVREQQPDRVHAMRVWQSDPQWVQVPQTRMTPVTEIRQVPVQSVRYVEEQHTRQVPVMTQQWQEQQLPPAVPMQHPCDAQPTAVPYGNETPTPTLDPRYQPPTGQMPLPGPVDSSPSDERGAQRDEVPLDPRNVAYRGALVPVERSAGKSLADVARSSGH